MHEGFTISLYQEIKNKETILLPYNFHGGAFWTFAMTLLSEQKRSIALEPEFNQQPTVSEANETVRNFGIIFIKI